MVTSGKKDVEGGGVKPRSVKLAVLFRKGPYGPTVSDLHVRWAPDTCAGLVYYRTFGSEWLCAGAGLGQMVIPGVSVGLTYDVAVVGDGGKPDKPDATITVSGVTAPPTAPTNVGISLALEGEKAVLSVSWDASIGDIECYEVRFNGDAGNTHKGYYGRTADVQYRCAIPDEAFSKEDSSLTVYVYARDVWGQYSEEAVCKKTIAVPKAPLLTVKPEINALYVRCVPQSSDMESLKRYAVITIDGTPIRLSTEAASAGVHLPKDPGVYTVSASWAGLSGMSPKAPDELVTVKKNIDPDLIGEETITLSKIDKAVQGEIAKATTAQQEVTRIVGNLSSVESAREAGYTAITQLQDAIGLKVSKGDVKSEVALGLQGVTLSGKQVHITGDTVIDKDVITKGMIQAGAITGDKLDVKDLSSITANIGVLRTKSTGARMEIRDNCILIYDEQNRLRVQIGLYDKERR
ncbi:hypothetical protein [uncultured Megasphaera sp.]|uniref:hypothetical protein n=1 Tax=uncultured Megasphaera sp. TaxID=165188 RepID=UPI0025959FBB|nr:hypothetical protein [uncultured Megasphaera sp.]